ncbi:hypothetical protein P7K49_023808, partial [Saguinus oedipus]
DRGGALGQAPGLLGRERGPAAASISKQSPGGGLEPWLAKRTSAGAHPPPRGRRAQPGVGQEARTLKPNSWPETGAA